LADPTRRKILHLLRQREMSAGEIADHFPHAKPTLSRHFAVLREADLIQGDKRGNSIVYQLNLSVLEEAMLGFLEAFNIERKEVNSHENANI
jgi:DNA-binding transcriptional ArsR family regulator